MALPSALQGKCCASIPTTAPFPRPGPPWASLRILFLGHQQVSSQVLSNEELNFNHKKHTVATDFLRAHAGPSATPRPGFTRFYSGAHALTHQPFRSWARRLLALSQLSFFPIGKPGKMTEPVCVAKRLASTGSEGGKIELCVFFFSCL